MKRILTLLLLVAAIAIGAQARTYVLISAVSNYDDERTNLSQTTKDAKRFKQVIQTQTRDITMLTSSYATRENIMEKLNAICNRAQAGDMIIFFYSGHGMPNALYTYNGALPYSSIVEALEGSAASSKICFIDACHAGSAAAATSANNEYSGMSMPGTAFFVSSRADEYSIESPWIGAGFLAQALVKGLRGSSDRNHDRRITVRELFDYIYVDVVRRSDSQQHPQLIAPREMFDVVVADWND
ncbi:MAG: caspase family protein [Muribaculaceae bacterium]|nr:caspase family protein [Muribaculaceae bacterium]